MLTFRLKRTFKLGIKSLWMHRLRSTLTTLGIIFGVSSVIAMLAIGEGASRQAQEQIARLGSLNIIVKTVKPSEDQRPTTQEQTMVEYGLTYTDAERFQSSIPDVRVVVPSRRISQQARYRNRKVVTEVLGTVPWFTDISPIRLLRGRFLSSVDMHHKQGVCVVDEQVVTELFAFDDPIGQDVKIASDYYRVVGITSVHDHQTPGSNITGSVPAAPSSGGANVGTIYIPLTTVKDRFGETSIQISGSSGANIERVELQEIVVKVGSVDEVLRIRRVLETLLERFHKKNDYQVIVPLELLQQAKDFARIFSIVLGSIAAISLLVGGIGIMNIMLATVSERTREIGIRRALGAKKRDIVIQFLSETLLLTLTGGILGIVLGSAIPFFVTYFSDHPTAITGGSLVLAFGISATVGITFGLYPAYRAANMDPIESLRHE
ncbi:MAG: ABC transporter ATP-binding protein [Planctomycetota bacterium]|nr:MAG: ABC transporter ATP-binding protein [Planctomycetota bacterium]